MPLPFALTSPLTVTAYEGSVFSYKPTTNATSDDGVHSNWGGTLFQSLPACFDQANFTTAPNGVTLQSFPAGSGANPGGYVIPGDITGSETAMDGSHGATFVGQILQGTAGRTYHWGIGIFHSTWFGADFSTDGYTTYAVYIQVLKAVKITSDTAVSGTQGKTYDSTSPLYKFTYQSGFAATKLKATGLPAGLSISSGKIVGTPTGYGDFDVSIKASNANGSTTFSLKITILQVPHITSPSTYTLQVDKPVNIPVKTDIGCTVDSATLPTGLDIIGNIITGTPTATGDTTATLTATNANGSTTQTLTIHVITPPTISVAGGTDVLTGDSVTLTPTVSSGDVTVSGLPAGLSAAPTTGVVTGTAGAVGIYPLIFTVTDGNAVNDKLVTLTIHQQVAVTTLGPISATQGALIDYPLSANNSPVTYQLVDAPDWLQVTPNGHIIGTPTVLGPVYFVLRVDDGYSSARYPILINVAPAPAISITSDGTKSGVVGEPFTYVIETSIVSGVSISSPPPGLQLLGNTIAGNPEAKGAYQVTITATNGFQTGQKTLTITITDPPQIAITSDLSKAATVGSFFSYTITADQPVVSNGYSATGLDDLGLTQTGALISGTPTVSGVYSIALTVQGANNQASATLALAIAPAPQIQITSDSTATATQGQTFEFPVTTTPAATEFSATGLPSGLSIDATSGKITGASTITGTFPITITAQNSYSEAQATFTLTVNAPAVQADTSLYYRILYYNVRRDIVYEPGTLATQPLDTFTVKLEKAAAIKLFPVDDDSNVVVLPVNSVVYFTVKPQADYDSDPLCDVSASGVEADGSYILVPEFDSSSLEALFLTSTDAQPTNGEVNWQAPGEDLPHASQTFTVSVANDVRKRNQSPVPPPLVYPPIADVALTADLAQMAVLLLDGTQFRFAGPSDTWYSLGLDSGTETTYTQVDPDSSFVNAQLRFPGPTSTWFMFTVVVVNGTPQLAWTQVASTYGANASALRFSANGNKYTLSIDSTNNIVWTQVS
jgi:hypothetical protein